MLVERRVSAALGWRVFDKFFLGPELAAFASDNYRQYSVGIHATAFNTANFERTAAAGFASDNDHHGGAYGRIGVMMRR